MPISGDMNWLKPILVFGLLIAAAGVALATGLSNHNDDYGTVGLPQGGTVHLPKGEATIFYEETGRSDQIAQVSVPLTFAVTPAGGGDHLTILGTKNNQPISDASVSRSETIGELGAVAKVQVPADGMYTVTGRSGQPAGVSSLEFGTNSGAALKKKWKLIAGLIGAALLVSLIPVPRGRKRWGESEDAPGWAEDSTAAYARPRTPYSG